MLSNDTGTTRAADAPPNDPAPLQSAPGEHAERLAQMNKRVLLIAFHFPPEAISSGIQRTLSFFKHLGKYGWEPMVLSAHPRVYHQQNPSQLASLPPGQVVRRAFALDTKYHMGIKGRYLELLALPDRWVSWFLGAVPAGLSLIREHRPQVIWSTFPISTAHLIALALHRITGLPWVADFRDPMIQPSYPTSPLQRKVYQWIEHQAIHRCQAAVFTTQGAMNLYRERYADVPAAKFTVIENGYDEDGFDPGSIAAPAAAPDPARGLTLLHSGVLYQSGRDPSAFLQAIAQLKAAGELAATPLRVILRAPGNIEDVTALTRKFGVDDIVQVAPPVPYREALSEMLAADGLLVFQGTPFNNQIPAKIYEYFRARKPILSLVDPAGETAKVLRTAGFHDLADMDSAAAIAPVLRAFVGKIVSNEATIASDELITASSRKHRSSELARIFDSVTVSTRKNRS